MVHQQLVMAAADDGWVLAVRNTRRSRKRTFSTPSTAKCRFRFTAEAKAAEEHLTEAETAERVEGVQRTMERVKLEMPWKLRSYIQSTLSRIIDDGRRRRHHKLGAIRVFGLGSFTRCTNSLVQLALLEHIMDHFNVPFMTSQEPLTTGVEQEYLQRRGVRVLPPDNLRSKPPRMSSKTDFTLLYMLHCTQDMYDSVLSRYSDLRRVILIGNDPHYMIANTLEMDVYRPHLANFAKLCTSIPLPKVGLSYEMAFYLTSVSFLGMDGGEDEENDN